MKRIFKYTLPPIGEVGLGMHGDPRLLALGVQGTQFVMWAEVDESEPVKVHPFAVVLTGGDVPEGAEYVGTAQAQFMNGPFVAHVYRLRR